VRSKPNVSIIDKGLTVEGEIASQGKLIIKGTMNGTLKGDSVIIAEGGYVKAEMTARAITVSGMFEGDIKATEQLMILSTGKCSGKITCKQLIVEAGAVIQAEIVSGKSENIDSVETAKIVSVTALRE